MALIRPSATSAIKEEYILYIMGNFKKHKQPDLTVVLNTLKNMI